MKIKIARRGMRVEDFIDLEKRQAKLEQMIAEKSPIYEFVGMEPPSFTELEGWSAPLAEKIAPFVSDSVAILHSALEKKGRVFSLRVPKEPISILIMVAIHL